MGKPITINDLGLKSLSSFAWLEKTCRGKPQPEGQFTEGELVMLAGWITHMEAILTHLRLIDQGRPDALQQLTRHVEDEIAQAKRYEHG